MAAYAGACAIMRAALARHFDFDPPPLSPRLSPYARPTRLDDFTRHKTPLAGFVRNWQSDVRVDAGRGGSDRAGFSTK